MSAIDTLKDALFGNPPVADHRPDRTGVFNAFVELAKSVTFSALGIGTVPTSADLVAPGTDDPKLVFVLTGSDAGLFAYVNNAWSQYTAFYQNIASIVQPLIDQVNASGATIQTTINRLLQLVNYVTVPGYLFVLTDKNGNMVVSVDNSGVMTVNGEVIASTGTSVVYRFYTFEDRDGPNWKLRAYDGADNINFPTEVIITYNGLPAGLTVRDPKVIKIGGKYVLVHSAYGFGTGAGAAQFAVAISTDGKTFNFVRLVSMAGFVADAKTAWAPDAMIDKDGGLTVTVSCWLGETETNTSGSGQYVLKMYMVAPTTLDFAGDWRLLGPVTGAAIPKNSIDASLIYYNGFNVMTFKNESTKRLRQTWSKSITGPYDLYNDLDLGNFDTEGPDMEINRNTGRFTLLYDRNATTGAGISVSDDFGKTYTAYQTVTTAASAGGSLPRHGSIVKL